MGRICSAKSWTFDEVVERWGSVFSGNDLINRYRAGEPLSEAEKLSLEETVEACRANLMNISWFMRCMNETIARMANREDKCTGRFWEGRFKSQALLDVKAVISCMAYVDLNPVRAGQSETLEGSDFTSVQERLFALAKSAPQPVSLAPCSESESLSEVTVIPMPLVSYISLVEATGRAIRSDKPGYIPEDVVPVLHQLEINPYTFIEVVKNYTSLFKLASGSIADMKKFNRHFGKQWTHGLKGCGLLGKEEI
jgi:hypothetical protein